MKNLSSSNIDYTSSEKKEINALLAYYQKEAEKQNESLNLTKLYEKRRKLLNLRKSPPKTQLKVAVKAIIKNSNVK